MHALLNYSQSGPSDFGGCSCGIPMQPVRDSGADTTTGSGSVSALRTMHVCRELAYDSSTLNIWQIAEYVSVWLAEMQCK
jgi:hypothetical protein